MAVLTDSSLNAQARRVTQEILRLAEREDLDSSVLILALADVVGITAGVLDRRDGVRQLDRRLGSFEARVREKYQQIVNASANPCAPLTA